MLETTEGLAVAEADQPAQALLADAVDVAVETRLEKLEHAAQRHGHCARRWRKTIVMSDSPTGVVR